MKYSKMYTAFMNSGNSKTSDIHILLISLSDKIYVNEDENKDE